MGKCIQCGRNLVNGAVIGKTCAKNLNGPNEDFQLSMVRLLFRLKHEARNLGIKVEYDFKTSVADCVSLSLSPSTEDMRKQIIERISYYMQAHKVFGASVDEQLSMAENEEDS